MKVIANQSLHRYLLGKLLIYPMKTAMIKVMAGIVLVVAAANVAEVKPIAT